MRMEPIFAPWLAAFTLMTGLVNSPAAELNVGQPFPSIAFPDLDGAPKSIADFQGRKTILHIFASW